MNDVFNDGRLTLASGEEIRMMHYRQEIDTEKANLVLNAHLLCIVLQGHKKIWHPQGRLEIRPGEGFFLAKGNYLRAERRMDPQLGYQSLVIGLSDAFLLSLDGMKSRTSGEQAPEVFHLREDILVGGLVQQLLQYFQAPEEKARIERLLPLKIRELMLLFFSAKIN